jgi:hypothetical protein
MRILLHRHYVLSASNIQSNPSGARVVVETAKDTIQVLVHLHESSSIYIRQQVAFNHFLISALAAIFLAVCHAPATYSTQCRDSFFNAIELLRGLSHVSTGSRRLWKSIKGLLPGARVLGLDQQQKAQPSTLSSTNRHSSVTSQTGPIGVEVQMPGLNGTWMSNQQSTELSPYQMSTDLTSFFEVFGQNDNGSFELGNESNGFFNADTDEVSRLLQGFI